MALTALGKHSFSTVVHTAMRSIVLFACGALSTSIACSNESKARDTSTHQSNTIGSPFRVALLTPGPISDQSWNGGAYQGLLRIRDSLGARVSHIQTKTPAELEENFRQYGAQGYTLVF